METRRFTLTISGVRGMPQEGEVVLARRWQPEWGRPEPKSAFLIVLLEEPALTTPRVVSAGVAVCVPERPLDTPFAVRAPDRIGGLGQPFPHSQNPTYPLMRVGGSWRRCRSA